MKKLRLESLEERTLLAVTAGTEAAAAPLTTSSSIVVTTLDDVEDSADGVVSLREAIAEAAEGDTVTFDAGLAGGTITLSGTQLEITAGITIDASDIGGITVDADGASRVFSISGGTADSPVTLIGLTITGGAGVSQGGGVYAADVSVLSGCTISGNAASSSFASGGAIYNTAGTMTLTDCVISGNSATGSWMAYGAAVFNTGSTLTLTGCLISGNTAGGGFHSYAGGIYNVASSVMTLSSCTVAGNVSNGTYSYAGGIWNYSEAYFYNTVIAENSAATSGTDVYLYTDCDTIYAYNTLSTYEGWTASSDCIVYDASAALFTDAESGDYSLAEGSQAIDLGNNDYVSAETDLAGNTRIVNSIVDLGAYEYQTGGESEQLDAPSITTGSDGVYVSYGANRHLITWDAVDNASGYELAYSADGGSAWTAAETEETGAVVTGLAYGADMTYRVRALGTGSYTDSDWSETVTFNVCPMDINNDGDITASDRSVLATAWLASEGDDEYQYYCDVNADGDVGGADRVYLANNWLAEAGDEDLTYPASAADAAFAEFASAGLDIDLDVF